MKIKQLTPARLAIAAQSIQVLPSNNLSTIQWLVYIGGAAGIVLTLACGGRLSRSLLALLCIASVVASIVVVIDRDTSSDVGLRQYLVIGIMTLSLVLQSMPKAAVSSISMGIRNLGDFRVSVARIYQTLCAIVAYFALTAEFARYWWISECLAAFRLQYFLILVVAAIESCIRRNRIRAASYGGIGVITVLHLYWHAPMPIGDVNVKTQGRDMRVMVSNVHQGHTANERVTANIVASGPDLVGLLEIDGTWESDLQTLEAEYPHRAQVYRLDPFGLALLSRYPLLSQRVQLLSGIPALVAEVDDHGKKCWVVLVHLLPPSSWLTTMDRNRQIDELDELLTRLTGCKIIMGDMNLSNQAPAFNDFKSRNFLTEWDSSIVPTITWPAFLPLLGIKIDHVLTSNHLRMVELRSGPNVGSDHYPILATLRHETTVDP